ncbi:hypothetical protein PMAYCL1PPCAC_05268, partial [Pristionchus mayeri]
YLQTRTILLPVLLSIGLTQALWVGFYGCQMTRNNFRRQIQIRIIAQANAGIAVLVMVGVSIAMLTLAIFHFRRVVTTWLALSSLVSSFVIAGSILCDAASLLPLEEHHRETIGLLATSTYGGGAVLSIDNLP